MGNEPSPGPTSQGAESLEGRWGALGLTTTMDRAGLLRCSGGAGRRFPEHRCLQPQSLATLSPGHPYPSIPPSICLSILQVLRRPCLHQTSCRALRHQGAVNRVAPSPVGENQL